MATDKSSFTDEQKKVLDLVQRKFPLEERPYKKLGDIIGISEARVIDHILELKENRIIRQISAIFNTSALGYKTSLVAMKVPEEKVEDVARVINEYPGVSHNYLRPGTYNLWFTIAVPPDQSLEAVVEQLRKESGSYPAIILPAIKKYKLAMVLDVIGDDGDPEEEEYESSNIIPRDYFEPTEKNIRIVRCVQEDLPMERKPFAVWADQLGVAEDFLLKWLISKDKGGIIRRFAAVLDHRRAGFTANGMIVWHCDIEELDSLGEYLARQPEVTHCYHRPAHPEWPYNLYAMVHGRTKGECLRIAARLASLPSLREYKVLFSTKEFKKIRLKLFWDYN